MKSYVMLVENYERYENRKKEKKLNRFLFGPHVITLTLLSNDAYNMVADFVLTKEKVVMPSSSWASNEPRFSPLFLYEAMEIIEGLCKLNEEMHIKD
jgi:hypothetical protein